MSTTLLTRTLALAVLLFTVGVTLIPAQGPASTAPVDVSELLAEVRALRAEVNRAAGASMRMQLLLARLTLQEQRIAALGREMGAVQNGLLEAGSGTI